MRINFTGRAHRHTPEGVRPLDSLGVPAPNDGRYHRLGQPRPFYGATTRTAAWKEAARRVEESLLRLVGHRMSTVAIRDARLLDLTHPKTLEELDLKRDDLVGDDLTLTQELADRARDEGLAGVLGPSAAEPADPAVKTVVIFPEHLGCVTVEDESVEPFPGELS
jgi:RES domain-containing protein